MAKVRRRAWSNSNEQTAWIAAAALGAVLAFGATAAYSAEKHRGLRRDESARR